jgi:hypothetical protein
MSGFGLTHWLIIAVVVAFWIVPAWRIAARVGIGGAWSLLLIIPVAGMIAYWVFAFMKWPIDDQADHHKAFD